MTVEYFKGHDTYIIYGEESGYGTGGTPAAGNRIGRVQSATINMANNMFRTQGLGEGRNATGAFNGAFDINGTIDWDVDDFTFMQYAVGTLTGAGIIANPYQLEEAANIGYDAANIPSLALEFGSEGDTTDLTQTVSGLVVNSLTLTASQGETLKASCDWIGQTMTNATVLEAYTAPTDKVFVFQQGTVAIGTDAFQCMSFSLTLNNNTQTHRDLGSRFIVQPVTGTRRYDFTVTFKFKKDTTASTLGGLELMDYFYGAANTPTTSGSSTAYAVSLDITEGAASGDRVVNIDLETCYFTNWTEPISLEGGVIEVTVEGFGLAGLTDGAVNVPIRWYTIA
jgi:hypothetical protein|tara:strand:- start:20203 stop:21219 length:1017 start_codon:yes stop_codon:yes gene_type:complete